MRRETTDTGDQVIVITDPAGIVRHLPNERSFGAETAMGFLSVLLGRNIATHHRAHSDGAKILDVDVCPAARRHGDDDAGGKRNPASRAGAGSVHGVGVNDVGAR